jgi:UDP-glucuronate decarboxylase
MIRNLITGGAGFIGSHLCEHLLTKGEQVICIDNFSTGKQQNIQHFLSNRNFTFEQRDVTTPFTYNVDRIYNLASPASPKHYQADPVSTIRTNVLGAINVLELAKNTNSRVLQASTSEVYGDPLVNPQLESHWGHVNPIGPRACYDEGKRCAETLFFDYRRQYNVDIKVMRIFNTYGPRMQPDDGRVVSNFIVQALKGEDITIYGNGLQTRSFCFIDDLVSGMVAMMNSSSDFQGPVNIGNPNEFTMLELALNILRVTHSKSKIVFLPLPQDDPKQRRPNISLADSKLNWKPYVQLDDGIRETASYFSKIIFTDLLYSM